MDDFSTPGKSNVYGIPPSAANFVRPGKRPISSMAPSIIINKNGDAEFIIGAAGGSRISTSIAHAIIQYYYLKSRESLWKIFGSHRLHHQLVPNSISYDIGFDEEILKGLKARNHSVEAFTHTFGFGALVGILADKNSVQAAYDPRRGGSSVVF
jgi:gamma-glutamyltranspeptidase/glutathione hydrolase/leukotriene-C4 hydrolase